MTQARMPKPRQPAAPDQSAVLEQLEQTNNSIARMLQMMENQQRQINELRDGAAAPRLAPQMGYSVDPRQMTAEQAQAMLPAIRQQEAQLRVGGKQAVILERKETERRLSAEPRVPVLVTIEHAAWIGQMKFYFGPAGETLNCPVSIAKYYMDWLKQQSEINNFKKQFYSQSVGGSGMLQLEKLNSVIGYQDD